MAIFSSTLSSALDRSATFLTVLAGRTVKIAADREVPGSNPGGPNQKLHRSIDEQETNKVLGKKMQVYCLLTLGNWF